MANYVSIKSYTHGLKVFLDPDISFDTILSEVVSKFKDSEKFFKNNKIALTFEGRELSEEEERILVNEISLACDINIVCIIGKDTTSDQLFLKAVKQIEHDDAENNGQFYKGNLKNGQLLETEKSIVILGDVFPNSSVVSKKNIVILGGLYGEAYAGAGGENHFVFALDMAPQKLRIADFKGKLSEKQNKWLIKPKQVPKIAYIKEGTVIIEEVKFTEELLDELIF